MTTAQRQAIYRTSPNAPTRTSNALWVMQLFTSALFLLAFPAFAQQSTTWHFDNLTRLGDAHATIFGKPQVVDTAIGKAVHFEGRGTIDSKNPESGYPDGDALFLDAAPVAGDSTYTVEVVFRPSSKGAPAQRFFHQQDEGSESRRILRFGS